MAYESPFVGVFDLAGPKALAQSENTQAVSLKVDADAWHIENFVSAEAVDQLLKQALGVSHVPVGADGIRAHYEEDKAVGSLRCSALSPPWAQFLWEGAKNALPYLSSPLVFDEFSAVDWDKHTVWQADGTNPLLRFIRYRTHEGELVGHYDAPYIESPTRRTLFSLILYLTDQSPADGGQTRFLKDPSIIQPHEARDFSDWSRTGTPNEVFLSISPKAGDALIFPHRLLHDSSRLAGLDEKWILRTDVFFSHARA